MAFWNREKKNNLTKEEEKERLKQIYEEKRTLTLEKLFNIAGLPYPGNFSHIKSLPVSDFSCDPRRLKDTSVFFSLGKKYSSTSPATSEEAVNIAIEKKCLFIISDIPCAYENSIYIDDNELILEAFINASSYIRGIHKAKVIGVTGSAGKTSTKEMIASVLRAHYKKPLISKGNYNSIYSVCRNIQKLKRTTGVYLQEAGAFAPGSVECSARQLVCDIAVYTNIGQSHIETYGTQENIAEDKLSLSAFGRQDGYAIVNCDDEILMKTHFNQQVITYSLNNTSAMYYASDMSFDEDGISFDINNVPEGKKIHTKVYVPGTHNVLNAVAAYAAGKLLKLDDEEIVKGIADFRSEGIRQNLLKAAGYTILADCFNSSLIAVGNILEALDSIPLPAEGGRRIAVLGDVLALGDESEKTHREIGEVVADHNVDMLLAYGAAMEYAHMTAKARGVCSYSFLNKEELTTFIKENITKEDIILFKGSHGMNLGSIIDRLYGTDINESSSISTKNYTLLEDGDFEYYIFEDSASIRRYLGEKEEVFIPAEVTAAAENPFLGTVEEKTLRVEKIGKRAFRDMIHVKKVHLPETVVRIRDGAFMGSGLVSFEGTKHLLSIGSRAFASCPDLKEIRLYPGTSDYDETIAEDSPQAEII